MVGKCHENATAEHTSEVRAAVPALSWADTSLNRSLTIPYNDSLLKCPLPVATRVSRGAREAGEAGGAIIALSELSSCYATRWPSRGDISLLGTPHVMIIGGLCSSTASTPMRHHNWPKSAPANFSCNFFADARL